LETLKNINFEIGKSFTYIPIDTDKTKIYKFKRGDIVDLNKTKVFYKRYLEKYLANESENIIIFENSASKKGDKWLNISKSKIISYGDDIYHVLTPENINEIEITRQEATNAWLNITFLSHFSKKKILTIKTFDKDDLFEISKNVKGIVVDAYDLDGFIFCEIC